MKRKQTPGERIAFSIDPEGTIAAAVWRKKTAARIDRAIRRAWNEGMKFMLHNPQFHDERANAATWNPYRKAKR